MKNHESRDCLRDTLQGLRLIKMPSKACYLVPRMPPFIHWSMEKKNLTCTYSRSSDISLFRSRHHSLNSCAFYRYSFYHVCHHLAYLAFPLPISCTPFLCLKLEFDSGEQQRLSSSVILKRKIIK